MFISRENIQYSGHTYMLDFLQLEYYDHVGHSSWRFFARASSISIATHQDGFTLPTGWVAVTFDADSRDHAYFPITPFILEMSPCYGWLYWHTFWTGDLQRRIRILRVRVGVDPNDPTLDATIGISTALF